MLRESVLEMRGDRLAPGELVAILFRIDDLSLRHIGADDASTGDGRGDQALLFVDEVIDARDDVDDVESLAREDRDAVVCLLPGVEGLIASGVEWRGRKFGVLELRFLQA